MAKIPRINQSDRPSTAGVDVMRSVSSGATGMLGAVAGLAETGAMAMVNVEKEEQRQAAIAAAEQKKALKAEQKRLADALAAKQKIVDAAAAGRINLEFEDAQYTDMAEIEKDQAIPWEKKVDEFTVRTRQRADSLLKREDINDDVKLAVVKNAESSMGSGLSQMHNLVQAGMSRQAKADIAEQFNVISNGAIRQGSAMAAEDYSEMQLAKLEPIGRNVLGAGWDEEKKRLRSAIAERYAANAARHNPLGLMEELKSSKFLNSALSPEEHETMTAAAENGYKNLNDTRNMEIAAQAFSAGETLANVLGTDDFISGAASRMDKLQLEKKNAAVGLGPNGERIKKEDIPARLKNLDEQIKRVKVLQEMNYKQLDRQAIDDVDTIHLLTVEDGKILDAVAKSKDSGRGLLDVMLKQQDALERARDAKKITLATYNTMKGRLSSMYQGAVDEQSTNDGWFIFVNAEEQGVKEINKQMADAYSEEPLEVRNRIWVEYTREFDRYKKENRKVDAKVAVKIAQQVISKETGKSVPGAFD